MRRVSYLAVVLAGLILMALPGRGLAQVAAPAVKTLPAGDYAAISLDPAASGVSAVNEAAELMKSQGIAPDQQILWFTAALDASKNFSVARMIRFRLVELYKEANRPDQALLVLKDLMTLTPQYSSTPAQVIQIAPAATNGDAAATGGQQ
jgi:hypothetical protein